MIDVAALYIDAANGPYATMPGVDAWGLERDGRAYDGLGPIVAHPPCGHWGNMAWNCKQPEAFRECGPIAVRQVRENAGVLEHPAGSKLWKACSLPRPGEFVGREFTIQVDQVWWGHKARKRTWLFFACAPGVDVFRAHAEVWRLIADGADQMAQSTHVMGVPLHKGRTKPCLPKRERHLTPQRFADFLVQSARVVSGLA